MGYKVTADFRCPPLQPYAVVDTDTNKVLSFHRSRPDGEAALATMTAPVSAAVSSKPWASFQDHQYDLASWARACIVDRGTGASYSRERFALPVREPNGVLNRNAVRFAADRIDQLHGISEEVRSKAAQELVKLFGEINEDPPKKLVDVANMPPAIITQLSNRSGTDDDDDDPDDDDTEKDRQDALKVGARADTKVVEARMSTTPWAQFTDADYTPAQYRDACLIDKGTGDADSKDRYALPVKEPNGQLNVNGVHAAASRLSQTDAPPEKKAAAARRLVTLYGQMDETCPDSVTKLAVADSDTETRATSSLLLANAEQAADILAGRPVGAIELRAAASIGDVNHAQRIITTVAAPYEQAAPVMGGQGFGRPGEIWQEIFCRSAFAALAGAAHRIRVNRDHNKSRTVGRVLEFREENVGLIAETKIARTPLGDETLELADDNCLGASVGMAVRASDCDLDRQTRTRRIRQAYMDHLSFVEDPAYVGAEVLQVRDAAGAGAIGATEPGAEIDAYFNDPVVQWATERLRRA